jgi:formylglycine-generating enzyme required for sulfatase activity
MPLSQYLKKFGPTCGRWARGLAMIGAFILAGLSGSLMDPGRAEEAKAPSPAPPPDLPGRVAWKADGLMMVKVPAGVFQMGGNKTKAEEPRHPVELPVYYIDHTEVTWRAYLTFCKETNRQPPISYFQTQPFPPEKLDYPVANVTWSDADEYCRWAGKRLPGEAEWEKACAGPSGQTYPWGEGWNQNACVNRINSGDRAARAGSRPSCKSPVGALDLAGNVWEWTADWYQNYEGSSAKFDYTGSERVVKGGAYFYSIDLLRCQNRYHLQPDDATDHGGFRCAVTPAADFAAKTEPK